MAAKLTEHLVILNDFGEGLLNRAYNVLRFEGVKNLEPELDRFLKNKLAEGFPKISEKLLKEKGMLLLNKRATELSTSLHGYYYTFLDVIRFNEKTVDALVRGASMLLPLDVTTAPDLAANYLSLVTTYAKLQVLMSRSFEAARYLLSAYARAHHLVSGNSETHFPLIAQYVLDNDKPFDCMRADPKLQAAGPYVGRALLGLMAHMLAAGDRVQLLKQGVFNVVDRAGDIVSTRGEPTHRALLLLSGMREWVLWGYLVFPAELATDGAVGVLGVALADTFFPVVHRDELLNVHELLETLFDDFQVKATKFKLSKHKKVLKDAVNDYDKTLQTHADMRRLLVAELQSVTALFRFAPQTAGPKLMLALALLRAARDEVLWQARHQFCKAHRASSKFAVLRDPLVSELVHRSLALAELLVGAREAVVGYSRAALGDASAEFRSLKEVFSRACSLPPTMVKLLDDIAAGLAAAADCTSFEALRMNVLRMTAAMSTLQAGIPSSASGPMFSLLVRAAMHSRAADSLDRLLLSHGSFAQLHWFPAFVQGEVAALLAGPTVATVQAVAYTKVLAHAVHNVHRVCPEELRRVGEQSAVAADDLLRRLVAQAVAWLGDVAADASDLRISTTPLSAGKRLVRGAVSGGAVSLPMPGAESQPGAAGARGEVMVALAARVRALSDVCGALAACPSLVVYTFDFSPREFLSQGLQHYVRGAVRRACVRAGQPSLQRPTLMLAGVRSIATALALVERAVPIDLSETLRLVLQTEFTGVYAKVGGESVGPLQGLTGAIGATTAALGGAGGAGGLDGGGGGGSGVGGASSSAAAAAGGGAGAGGVGGSAGGASSASAPTSSSSSSSSASSFGGGSGGAAGAPVDAAAAANAGAQVSASEERAPLREPILTVICAWYSWLFSQELDTMGIRFNQQRLCFEARPYANERGHMVKPPVEAELYTDRSELVALATLLGPRGVAELQRQLLVNVSKLVGERLFKHISANAALLSQIRGHFTETQLWVNTADQLQHKNEFLEAAVVVGATLRFRTLLQAALREVTMEAAPLVARSVDQAIAAEKASLVAQGSALGGLTLAAISPASSPLAGAGGSIPGGAGAGHHAASPSLGSAAALALAATSGSGPSASAAPAVASTRLNVLVRLAESCGAPFEVFDTTLCDALRRFKTTAGDAQVWALLPEMFAMCCSSTVWLEAKYDLAAEAHDSNVHLLVDVIRELITIFTLLPSLQQSRAPAPISQEEGRAAVRAELERFVECAAYAMLNIGARIAQAAPASSGSTTSTGERPVTVPPQLVVFLEHFVDACPTHVAMSKLEDCFPYTLLRTNYIQLYEQQVADYAIPRDDNE